MRIVLAIVTLLIIVAAVALMVLPAKAPTVEPTYAAIENLITVESPSIGASVSSPLVATGKARGTWYFEASFPLELRDSSGTTIAQGYAEAQSDWMTEEFVRFVSIPLVFPPQPAGSTGTLIVHKDNPSGLPEHDRSLEVPVIFR